MTLEKQTKLEYQLWGREETDAPTLVMIAGWPDTAEVFGNNFVARFSDKYRIIGVTLPGFTRESAAKRPLLGWTFDEVVQMFRNTLDEALAESRCPQRPLIIAHDWGCVVLAEFLLRWPRYFSKLVFLDVGPQLAGGEKNWTISGLIFGSHFSMPFSKLLFIVLYQFYLIFAFFLTMFGPTSFIGDFLARRMARDGRAPQYVRDPANKNEKGGLGGVHGGMGYFYYQLWSLLLTGHSLVSHKFPRHPIVPVLYCYGAKKPFHFHNQAWLDHLAQRKDGSQAISYVGNHWFYADPKRPSGAQAISDVEAFLAK